MLKKQEITKTCDLCLVTYPDKEEYYLGSASDVDLINFKVLGATQIYNFRGKITIPFDLVINNCKLEVVEKYGYKNIKDVKNIINV